MKKRMNIKDDVNQIKNHTATAITVTHSITFGMFYILEILLNHILKTFFPDGVWGTIIKAIFDAVTYGLLYMFVKFFYNKYIDFKKPKFNISGKWYHVHIPRILNSIDYSRECLSAGETVITRDLNDFTFVGFNYDFALSIDGKVVQKDKMWKTQWETETSEICDSSNQYDIIEVYKASSSEESHITIQSCPCCHHDFKKNITLKEASQYRYGIHKYLIKDENKMIVCEYSDCWPSLKSGHLFIFKNEKDRNNKIKEYFEEKKKSS